MFTLGSFEPRRPANQERSFGGALAGLAQRYGLMIVVAGAIAYGSLYPFAFHDSGSLGADISHLSGTWNRPPPSRGDILINLLLYMPFGFTALQAIGWGGARLWAAIRAVALGAALSLLLELTQFYDHGRFSALSDVYLNLAGAALGSALAGAGNMRRLHLSWPSGGTAAFARILLVAWLGWQLFPYAPTIDLHKYWRSIHPLLHASGMGPYDLFRCTVLWLSLIFAARIGLGLSARFLLLAIAGFFLAKILIIGQYIFLSDIAGAGLALVLCLTVRRRIDAALVPVAVLFAVMVVQTRLLPFQLAPEPKPFHWIPFFGFLHGSLQLNIIALWEKFYLYGALLLLLVKAGMRPGIAVMLECVILLATSLAQIFLIGRSAEVTDAVMALVLGLIYWGLRGWFPEISRRQPEVLAQ
jgi:VanZ family protein